MFQTILGIILIVLAVALVVCVLLQSGKDKGMTGALGGSNSDSMFGKNKGKAADRILSLATTVLSILFAILVVVMYIVIIKMGA